jgi:wobble nucleotide-excising tRNase
MSEHLSAMYGNDEDDIKKSTPRPVKPLENKGAKTRKITVGAIAYEVNSIEHVESLEKKIQELEREKAEQASKIRRMEAQISKLQQNIMKLDRGLTGMGREVDQKIDRRD